MTVPRVSVITPVYNGADHIAACIASVAASVTCGRIAVEHVIIDDGSTDGTVAAINRAVAALPPSRSYEGRLLRLSDNSGKPAYARNRGIEAAKGKFIFCLDHDDILVQNTLRYLASHLETTASEIAYGDFLHCDSTMVYEIGRDYYGWPHPNGRAALYSIFKGDHFYQHSFMFTKRLWHQVGGYDESITYGEDLDLCTRFILAGHLPSHLPITTHLHRDHGKNLTACYEHRSVWLAEKQALYHKYMHQLPLHLTPDQISHIQDALEITASTHLNGPLSQKAAVAIVAREEMKKWDQVLQSMHSKRTKEQRGRESNLDVCNCRDDGLNFLRNAHAQSRGSEDHGRQPDRRIERRPLGFGSVSLVPATASREHEGTEALEADRQRAWHPLDGP